MPVITYAGQQYVTHEGQTVLDVLLEAGVTIPFGCRSGACQSCLMRACTGQPGAEAQEGLRPVQKEQGYFLACQCTPKADLSLSDINTRELHQPAEVLSRRDLSPRVFELVLRPLAPFNYRAGQYITLWRDETLARSYSLASLPTEDEELRLQIARVQGGQMSNWLYEGVGMGDLVEIQGPLGHCVYEPENLEQPLLLVGIGTGLAPLYGILRDALAQGHRGNIHLVHAATRRDELYLDGVLAALASRHATVRYLTSVLEDASSMPVDELVRRQFVQLRGTRVYLCGAADMVQKLQRQVFLAGAALSDILTDPFS